MLVCALSTKTVLMLFCLICVHVAKFKERENG